jgi:hypothetical protein
MNTQELLVLLGGYPGFIPGVLVSLALGAIAGGRLGRVVGGRRALGIWLIVGAGITLSATLTPSPAALDGSLIGTDSCDLSRVGLATGNQLASVGEVALNILLFVPLGGAIGLIPRRRVRSLAIIAATLLPVAIEVVQLVVGRLGRACQSGDVIDNLTGLAIGFGGVLAVGWVAAGWDESGRRVAMIRGASAAASAAALLAVLVLVSAALTGGPAIQADPVTVGPTPAATATPAPGRSLRVDSIPDLLDALADDELEEIVVVDGTYHISTAASQAEDSLWIGGRFADRTTPVTVRAETVGGVTLDGGGATFFGGLTFVEGAHHQTWQGFNLANGEATDTGAITFGGYPDLAAPHDITLRDITILSSVTGRATTAAAPSNDHGIYVSLAVGGPHDLLLDNVAVDGRGGLASGIVFYHSDADHRNAWNVTVRRLAVTGTQQGIMLWDPTLQNIVFDTATIRDVLTVAVSYESPGATGIVFANITSTGSGAGRGFQSSLGASPEGVTFVNNSFR